MVIWHTDLDTLGLGGGTSSGGTDAESGSGSAGGEPPPAKQLEYVATCDAVQHPPGDFVFEGRWFGVTTTNFEEARAVASQHEHSEAYVAFYVNGVMVGPVTSH